LGGWVSDRACPSSICPYTENEIKQYLKDAQYHYSVGEPVVDFRVHGPILSRDDLGRKFWLFGAKDGFEREWFIVIGSGVHPFDSSKKMWRWMYAETNDLHQSPDAYLDGAIEEQLVHDMRDR
jgi:hypothetical protein